MIMKTITLINGNDKEYKVGVPKVVIFGKLNDVAFEHLKRNTKINFIKIGDRIEGEPVNFEQITAIFCTYNFITVYMNNSVYRNTLCLRLANVTSKNIVTGNIYHETNKTKEIISF